MSNVKLPSSATSPTAEGSAVVVSGAEGVAMRPCVFLPTHAALPIRLTISKRTFRRSVLLDTSHLVFFHHAARWMGLGLGTTS